MSVDVNPPNDDKETTRHKFYVAITSALDNNTKAMLAIGAKLDVIVAEHNTVAEEFKHLQTSIRTTLQIAAFLATIMGGVTGVMLTKTWQYADRLEAMERFAEIHEIKFKPYERHPEQLEHLKDRITALEEYNKRNQAK
jgi:hypothetical protein